jgi:predicted GH43/DUF377 family glycosyl hydrolase
MKSTSRREFLVASAASGIVLSGCRAQTNADWVKYSGNPVLGGSLGTCFDICVLKVAEGFRMWFSWRPQKSVARTDSPDGIHWSKPEIAIGPVPGSAWEQNVDRPVVVERADGLHMWYTGQNDKQSFIGYARSSDGVVWQRVQTDPVLLPASLWEGVAVMAPHVMWDEEMKLFRMWYSGGEQFEPNAIGYATSADGIHWERRQDNPVLRPDPAISWEKERVTAAQVVKHGSEYYAFYIGFRDVNHAAIGIARSQDGITNWERHPLNPIIDSSLMGWDHSACYKPYAIYDKDRWMLWYNGRANGKEQIGLATHMGQDLGFPRSHSL